MSIILLLCAAAISAQAQLPARSLVSGRVSDPSGAVIPGATVEIGSVAKTSTGARGEYSIAVPPNLYTVRISAPGFETFTRTLAVSDGETVALDISLEIPAQSQRITIAAKAPELEDVWEAEPKNWRETLEMREVRESPAKDVGEALTRLEGLWKIRKGGIANDVVLRGFQQDNINVLVDGARIYGACPNNMDPPAFHVDFAEVEQVEVTKGVFDIRNQGSLGGAINIISKQPEPGLNLKTGLAVGSFGFLNPSLSGSLVRGPVDAAAGYSFRRSLPYRDGAGQRFTDYANYRDTDRDREAFSVGTAWLRLGFTPVAHHRGQLAYTRQNGGEVLYPYLQMDAVYDNADRVTANYHGDWWRLESYFTRVRHWMTDEFRTSSIGAARSFGMGTLASTKALGGRLEASRETITAGVEGYRRNWNTATTLRLSGRYVDQLSIPDVNTTALGAYAQYRRALHPGLLLSAAARLDTARMDAYPSVMDLDLYQAYNGVKPATARRDTDPSGNALLAWRLPHGIELFAGAGRTVRLPDPQERYFGLQRMGSDWVGNPALNPTKNTEVDYGVNYRAGRFTLRPTVFYSLLDNYITVRMKSKVNSVPSVINTAARSFDNVDAVMRGAELTWSVAVRRSLLVSGGASYVRGTLRSGGNLPEIPPLKSRAAVRYGSRIFFAEFEGLAAWRQQRVVPELQEGPTPGFGVLNVKVGIHSRRLNLAAGVDNLLNRYYYDHFSFQRDPFRSGVRVPEPGLSLFLTTSYTFSDGNRFTDRSARRP